MGGTCEWTENVPSDYPGAFNGTVHVADSSSSIGDTGTSKEPRKESKANQHVYARCKGTRYLRQSEHTKSDDINWFASECFAHGRED